MLAAAARGTRRLTSLRAPLSAAAHEELAGAAERPMLSHASCCAQQQHFHVPAWSTGGAVPFGPRVSPWQRQATAQLTSSSSTAAAQAAAQLSLAAQPVATEGAMVSVCACAREKKKQRGVPREGEPHNPQQHTREEAATARRAGMLSSFPSPGHPLPRGLAAAPGLPNNNNTLI